MIAAPTSIGRFTPPPLVPEAPDMALLEEQTGTAWQYAPSGRACLWRILTAHPEWLRVALPDYACACLRHVVLAAGRTPIWLPPGADLQVTREDLEQCVRTAAADVVLAVGLYGYPLDMPWLEALCTAHHVGLIDDAAQCFGSYMGTRAAGTFGDAGFFSFSPGKPLAGHGGALYRSRLPLPKPEQVARPFYRWLKWHHFRIARLEERPRAFLARVLGKYVSLRERGIDVYTTAQAMFERHLQGGVLNPLLRGEYAWRPFEAARIMDSVPELPFVRPAIAPGTQVHPHKLVLRFVTPAQAHACMDSLAEQDVFSAPGYASLSGQWPLDALVVEVPLPWQPAQREYLTDALRTAALRCSL